MIIPGFLITIVTFPGVVLHEWAHKFFCDRLGVRVHRVVYFRLGNPAGFVEHDPPASFAQTFWISIGPLIVNSLLSIAVAAVSYFAPKDAHMHDAFFWLAIAIGMHAFPSDHDASHIVEKARGQIRGGGSPLFYAAFPLFWLVWLANKLRFLWFDLFYAVGMVFLGEALARWFG
jgi:hypothetical protein